jgi:hypothetical protein
MGVCLKIVLLYSDRGTAKLGKEVAQSLCEKLGPGFQARQSSWNAELLRSPKLRALSALEAGNSDLVIVAMDEGDPLRADVRSWLDLWRCRGRTGPAALVALLKRPTEDSPRIVEESLHAFADEARMDFFCHSGLQHDYPRLRINAPGGFAAVH